MRYLITEVSPCDHIYLTNALRIPVREEHDLIDRYLPEWKGSMELGWCDMTAIDLIKTTESMLENNTQYLDKMLYSLEESGDVDIARMSDVFVTRRVCSICDTGYCHFYVSEFWMTCDSTALVKLKTPLTCALENGWVNDKIRRRISAALSVLNGFEERQSVLIVLQLTAGDDWCI